MKDFPNVELGNGLEISRPDSCYFSLQNDDKFCKAIETKISTTEVAAHFFRYVLDKAIEQL